MADSNSSIPQCMGPVDLSTKRGRAIFGYNGMYRQVLLEPPKKKQKTCRGGSEEEAEHDEVSHGVQHEEKLLNDEADAKKPDNNQVCHKSAAAAKIVLKPNAKTQARRSDVAEPPRGKSPLSRSSSICSSRGRSRRTKQGSESPSESPSSDSSQANSDDDTDDKDRSPGNASGANVSFPAWGGGK